MDGPTEGARDLILAIFRLAVADYVGLSYGHDGPAPARRIDPRFRSGAMSFLTSPWANYLADLIGISAEATWREARSLLPDFQPKDRAA